MVNVKRVLDGWHENEIITNINKHFKTLFMQ